MAKATNTNKDERIYIRIQEEVRDDFDTVAEFRGLTRSGLLHSIIVKTIYEAKKENPEIFEKARAISLDEAKADDDQKRNK